MTTTPAPTNLKLAEYLWRVKLINEYEPLHLKLLSTAEIVCAYVGTLVGKLNKLTVYRKSGYVYMLPNNLNTITNDRKLPTVAKDNTPKPYILRLPDLMSTNVSTMPE